MNYDISLLKNLISRAKPHEILVLSVNKLEKNSLKLCQNKIDKFIKKDQDYTITVIKS